VWPEHARLGAFAAVIANHRAAARAAHAASYPAGAAWWDALGRRPAPPLYGRDAFHPSRLGTYLTAVAVYTGLTGELPRRLPSAVRGVRVPAATAARLRSAVAHAYGGR
jgi:hypothetical protein